MHEPENETVPFFQGSEPRNWTPSRIYRVYVLPRELLFFWAGSGNEIAAAAGAQFGLLGSLLASAISPREKNAPRPDPMGTKELTQLLGSHKHNFRASVADISGARVDPPSFWLAAMYHQHVQAGVFRFRHRTRGDFTLVLGTADELRRALEVLPPVLGPGLAVHVEWNARKNRYVRKS